MEVHIIQQEEDNLYISNLGICWGRRLCKEGLDIYSSDRKSETARSPSNQRCILCE